MLIQQGESNGQPVLVSVALQTQFNYDALGNLTEQIEGNGDITVAGSRRTAYEYDRLGRQTKVTQPGWYDPATGKVEATPAAGRFQRTLEKTYDAFGHTVRTALRTGVDTQYEYTTYDNLGRPTFAVDVLEQRHGL